MGGTIFSQIKVLQPMLSHVCDIKKGNEAEYIANLKKADIWIDLHKTTSLVKFFKEFITKLHLNINDTFLVAGIISQFYEDQMRRVIEELGGFKDSDDEDNKVNKSTLKILKDHQASLKITQFTFAWLQKELDELKASISSSSLKLFIDESSSLPLEIKILDSLLLTKDYQDYMIVDLLIISSKKKSKKYADQTLTESKLNPKSKLFTSLSTKIPKETP